MHTVTRRNPNGVPVAAPATVQRRTAIGAMLTALAWMRQGYVVEIERQPTSLAAEIRRRPAVAFRRA